MVNVPPVNTVIMALVSNNREELDENTKLPYTSTLPPVACNSLLVELKVTIELGCTSNVPPFS